MLTRLLVCGYMAAARLTELARSRRNIAGQGAAAEGSLARSTYPAMVALHTLTIALTLLHGGRPRWCRLALLAAVQPLRWWVLSTLGVRWNARGAVPETMDVATTGPYALVRHPNYSIVLVELWALPAAFGLGRLALLATLANALLLWARIHDEEALLFQQEAYRAHFGDKPRFLPYLF